MDVVIVINRCVFFKLSPLEIAMGSEKGGFLTGLTVLAHENSGKFGVKRILFTAELFIYF
jgi:hypothetical protein